MMIKTLQCKNQLHQKSINHVSSNGTPARGKSDLVTDGRAVAQEGYVSPDCAILRGFLAKEKSEWHPLEHKDGKM